VLNDRTVDDRQRWHCNDVRCQVASHFIRATATPILYHAGKRGENSELELDTLGHRWPVKATKQWCNVVKLSW